MTRKLLSLKGSSPRPCGGTAPGHGARLRLSLARGSAHRARASARARGRAPPHPGLRAPDNAPGITHAQARGGASWERGLGRAGAGGDSAPGAGRGRVGSGVPSPRGAGTWHCRRLLPFERRPTSGRAALQASPPSRLCARSDRWKPGGARKFSFGVGKGLELAQSFGVKPQISGGIWGT